MHTKYKLASLAFRAPSGLVPDYPDGDCQLVALSGRRPLRSAEQCLCHVPHQNSTFGDRSFAAACPRSWNELPFSLRDTGLSLTTFNEHLKTYLFSVAFWDHGAFVTFMIYLRSVKIYLLTYKSCIIVVFYDRNPEKREAKVTAVWRLTRDQFVTTLRYHLSRILHNFSRENF